MFNFYNEDDIRYILTEMARNFQRYDNFIEIMEGKYANKRGVTPYEVVYTRNRFRILRYQSDHPKRYKTPMVFCYALLNRYYVLDMTEEKSFVGFLLEKGWDVYMIDWGHPSKVEGRNSFGDYIEKYMDRGIDKILEITGEKNVNLFGYCLGSIVAMVYTAVHQEKVRNLMLLTPPIDFSDEGVLTKMAQSEYFNPQHMADYFKHLIPPEMIHGGFKLKDALANFMMPMTFWNILWNKKALKDYYAMTNWVDDNIPIAAIFWKELVTKMYKKNAIMNNTFTLDGKKVDFKDIKCPVLSIAAQEDNIVTPECASGATKIVGSKDKKFVIKKGGHIGVITGNRAKRELWPDVYSWMSKRSERIVEKHGNVTEIK